MYVNAKMTPVEMIPGIRGRGIKENSRGVEFMYDIFFVRTCVNATMYPHPSQ
jgi:hypothetical protein